MSIEAWVWALKFAPPMPAQLVATLLGLAEHADEKGRGAYPSVPTLAAYACKSSRSVQRDLGELLKLGLVRKGDQSLVAHLPADKRTIVYDLAVERVVPGGRAGNDETSRAAVDAVVSARARGGRRPVPEDESGVTPTSPGDADVTPEEGVRGDAHVTPGVTSTSPRGVTPTSERGDVGVASGVTPTSPKPSYEPSLNPYRGDAPHGAPDDDAIPGQTCLIAAADEAATETAPPKTRRNAAPSATPAPDDFEITDRMREWAATKGITDPRRIDNETERFLDSHRAKGNKFRDWTAAWRTWMSRSLDYTPRQQQRQTTPASHGTEWMHQ